MSQWVWMRISYDIFVSSSFRWQRHTKRCFSLIIKHTMQKSILYAVLNVFSMAFFVHIVWCWSRCWCCCFCQLRMVGYIFLYIFSNLHVWEKSYVLYLHFNLWHCGVFFSHILFSVWDSTGEREGFSIFSFIFKNIFVLCEFSARQCRALFWFPIECSHRLCHFAQHIYTMTAHTEDNWSHTCLCVF